MPKEIEGSSEQQEDEVLDVFADDALKTILSAKEDDSDAAGDEGNPGDESTDEDVGDEVNDKVPEKFRGKSLEEIVESYSNLERAYGQRSNDIGELRKTLDSLVQQQLASATSTSDDDDDDESDRDRKTRKEIEDVKHQLVERERKDQKAVFVKDHPDAEKIATDPRFQAWVNASPTRVRLFQEADSNYDYALAGELLTLYKDNTKESKVQTETKRTGTVQALKGAKPNANGGGAKPKRRVFKSSDLMKLKDRDPDRYERLQPEILKAYNEGRVLRDA